MNAVHSYVVSITLVLRPSNRIQMAIFLVIEELDCLDGLQTVQATRAYSQVSHPVVPVASRDPSASTAAVDLPPVRGRRCPGARSRSGAVSTLPQKGMGAA